MIDTFLVGFCQVTLQKLGGALGNPPDRVPYRLEYRTGRKPRSVDWMVSAMQWKQR